MGTVVQCGVDLGQKQDPTAIVVAEVVKREGKYHYLIRHLERLPLNTSYPTAVDRLLRIGQGLAEKKVKDVAFFVDATGLGQPVVDLLREAGLSPLTAVYLTGTDKASSEGRNLHLGKALLVSRLQVLLQSGRIHLPQTAEAGALVDELLNYEIKVSEDAQASFGAFKTGTHDDLATALGLACWEEPAVVEVVPNPFLDKEGGEDAWPDSPSHRLARQHSSHPLHQRWAKTHFCWKCYQQRTKE
ncbi:MAG: hypothetical protein FJZ90_11705 [Chloroflexi bacterium]|nr:hypothetical protein [Chloroflexota bacterium]